MLNRTLLFSVIAVAILPLLLSGTLSATAADERAFFNIDGAVVLGQNQSEARRTPSLGEQVRRAWNRLWQDNSTDHNHQNESNQRQTPVVAAPAVPTQPPKPLTAAEIQQSTAPALTQQRSNAGNTPPQRAGSTVSPVSRNAIDAQGSNDELSISEKLRRMRETVFANDEVVKAAQVSRQAQRTTLTPVPVLRDAGSTPEGLAGDPRDFADIPSVSKNLVPPSAITSALPPTTTPESPDVFVPIFFDNPPGPTPRVVQEHVAPQQVGDPFPPQQPVQQPAQGLVVAPEQRHEPSRQLLVSASPQLAFEIEKPPSVVVGQEVIYRIRATNAGNVPAERVVLNVEVPPWVNIRHTDADNGNWVLLPRGDGSGVVDLKWEVNRINQGETHLLALWLVPQQHRAIELPIQYNFHRPAIVAKVEVQEPKLAMELIGPDEVRWNDPVTYMLIVRNIGNGSAERLRFELQQTSSEAQATTMEEPLLPGEGREIPISVRAGREQEQIDIAVVATGVHELKSEVRRRIRVLRPKLEMSVQTSPMHFVDEPAEILVRVVNNGNSDAENVTIRAELPLGAQHVTSSEGGLFVQQQQQNIVEWRGRSVGKGEVQTLSLICIPRREGECRISVDASEANGSPLVAGHGTFTAEAIIELDLAVLKPNGPIELGQEVAYTIEVTNTGTKAADEVEISMMFGEQLEPIAVAGREAHYTTNGQVFFEKIPTILPKQSVTLKVSVQAKGVGTAQVRAEVARADTGGKNVRLEQGLSAHIFTRRGATAEQPTHNEVFR